MNRRIRSARVVRFVLSFLLACGILGACAGPRVASSPPAGEPAGMRMLPPPPPPPSPPETEEMTAQGSVKLHFPAPGHSGIPPLFTWYRFPEATAYRLVLLDMNGQALLESPPTTENTMEFSAGWMESLPRGGVCFWQVVALNGGGEAIAKSSLRDFVYEP